MKLLTYKAFKCYSCLIILFVTGCSSGNSGLTAPLPQRVEGALRNGLTARFSVEQSRLPVNGTLNYVASLTNNTTAPITFTIWTGGNGPPVPRAAIGVKNAAGQIVFPDPNESPHGIPPPPLITTTLQPGDSLSESKTLLRFPFSSQGTYFVTADFVAGNSILELGPLTIQVR